MQPVDRFCLQAAVPKQMAQDFAKAYQEKVKIELRNDGCDANINVKFRLGRVLCPREKVCANLTTFSLSSQKKERKHLTKEQNERWAQVQSKNNAVPGSNDFLQTFQQKTGMSWDYFENKV